MSYFISLELPLNYRVSILAAPHILNLYGQLAILARCCADRGEGLKDYGVSVAEAESVLE